MPGFDSLQQQKRGNEANAARRQSMSDQQGKGGFLMNLFHKYVVPFPQGVISQIDATL